MRVAAIKNIYRRALTGSVRIFADTRGVSAIEFAFILPIMLILFVITVELSNAYAVHRKVTIAARSLSDLISQATAVTDADLTNSFTAGSIILTPYSSAPMKAIISEVKIDDKGKATIAWTKYTGAFDPSSPPPHTNGDTVLIPPALAVPNTYLIWGEASYTYTPILNYLSKANLNLSDQFFTRPRQSACVLYNTTNCP